MKHVLLAITVLGVLTPLQARTWTNSEGREIEAEFVSSDGKTVKLKMTGREVDYLVENLSAEDQEWISEQKEKSPESASPDGSKLLTGAHGKVPITTRLHPEIDGYFKDKSRKSTLKAFEAGAFNQDGEMESDPAKWFARDDTDSFVLYVPESYDGSEPYGLYLNISPGDGGLLPDGWRKIFDQRKMIGLSANGTSNYQPMLRRVMLSIDAFSTVKETYKIDPKRQFVGGLSGGGHMGMLTAAMFPEHFVGAISHAAQSYLPSSGGYGHFPGMSLKDFTRGPRSELGWVVISGDKDQNYEEIKKTSKVWEGTRLHYRFIDVPGMAHLLSSPEKLAEAFDWILAQDK